MSLKSLLALNTKTILFLRLQHFNCTYVATRTKWILIDVKCARSKVEWIFKRYLSAQLIHSLPTNSHRKSFKRKFPKNITTTAKTNSYKWSIALLLAVKRYTCIYLLMRSVVTMLRPLLLRECERIFLTEWESFSLPRCSFDSYCFLLPFTATSLKASAWKWRRVSALHHDMQCRALPNAVTFIV